MLFFFLLNKQDVSFIQTGLYARHQSSLSAEEQEAEEILASVERRFKDVSSGLSVASCAKRAHNDIALTLQHEVKGQMTTQFIAIVIDAVGNVIMTIFVIIAALSLMEEMGGPLGEAVGEMVLKAVEPFVIAEIGPVVEERFASELLSDVTNNLVNKVASLCVRALVFHVPRAMGKELPPRLLNYMVRVESPKLAKEIAHNILHGITQKTIHTISHNLVETVALDTTQQLSHQLINYFYCVYCYEKGEFCRDCQTYNQFRAAGSNVR